MFSAVSLLLHLFNTGTGYHDLSGKVRRQLAGVFFSHHMGLGDQTQVFRLSGTHLYQPSLLSGPQCLFLKAYDFV